MDSLTQGLLGATVAECGFRHRLGRGATLMGALGGLLPDADFVLGAFDPWWSWEYHRHATHSVLFAPLAALPLAWLFWRHRRDTPFALWYLCAWLAIGTHPLLDLCTSYGTQLFLPFTSERLALDWIAIVDPVYSLILLVGLLGCFLLRRRGRSGRTWPVGATALALSTTYIFFGALNRQTAMNRIHDYAQSRGQKVLGARALPQIGGVNVWRLLYRTDNAIYVGRTNTRFNGQPTFTRLPIEDGPLIREADQEPHIRFFHRFAMGWARPMVIQTESGSSVIYDDLRYGWLPDDPRSLWAAVVDFDRQGQIVAVRKAGHGRRGSIGEMLQTIRRENERP
jgi:inner membrane protein